LAVIFKPLHRDVGQSIPFSQRAQIVHALSELKSGYKTEVQNARNTDLFRKQSGSKGPGFELPPTAVVTPGRDYGVSRRGFNGLSPLRLSTGVIENFKSQRNNNDQSACGGPNLFWSFDIGI